MIEQLEEKFGFKVENLNTEEKKTFFKMLEDMSKVQLTPEKMRDYLAQMRDAVERELVSEPTFIRIFLFKVENPKLMKLQARLQNYMLLEAFLMSPQRAKERLDEALNSVGGKVS